MERHCSPPEMSPFLSLGTGSYPPPVALLLDYRPCFQMSGILEDNMDKDTIIGRNMNMTCALYIVMFLAVKLTT